jgi:hypothetical protein
MRLTALLAILIIITLTTVQTLIVSSWRGRATIMLSSYRAWLALAFALTGVLLALATHSNEDRRRLSRAIGQMLFAVYFVPIAALDTGLYLVLVPVAFALYGWLLTGRPDKPVPVGLFTHRLTLIKRIADADRARELDNALKKLEVKVASGEISAEQYEGNKTKGEALRNMCRNRVKEAAEAARLPPDVNLCDILFTWGPGRRPGRTPSWPLPMA